MVSSNECAQRKEGEVEKGREGERREREGRKEERRWRHPDVQRVGQKTEHHLVSLIKDTSENTDCVSPPYNK